MTMRTGAIALLLLAPAWLAGPAGAPARAAGYAATFANASPIPLTIPLVSANRNASADTLVQQAHAQELRPAPLPDEDAAPPGPTRDALAAQQDASLSPGFFNPHTHFAGDGYAPGSTIEGDHNHRHTTGGGMSLSIPMQ